MIKMTQKFYEKMLKDLPISKNSQPFIIKYIQWLINSQYRTYKRLDVHLQDAIKNVEQNSSIITLANSLSMREPDETIINILKWVRKNITYKYDSGEEWLLPSVILNRKQGDCEDMNTLIYVLARAAGISQYQLLAWIGDVYNPNMPDSKEGHFALFYLSTNTNYWYPIDATYKTDYAKIVDRVPVSFSPKGYIKTWYLFNEEISFKGL